MESLLPEEELDQLEQTPLEDRATALEGIERRLRLFMDQSSIAETRIAETPSAEDRAPVTEQEPRE